MGGFQLLAAGLPMTSGMSDDPPYILDVAGLEDGDSGDQPGAGGSRRWIGMHFECCGVYTRIYRNPGGTAYEGRCPRCLRRARVTVGPGGTDVRIFRAL